MKNTVVLILMFLLLAACSMEEPPDTSSVGVQDTVEIAKLPVQEEATGAILDWIDFIHWNENQYVSLDSMVLTDPRSIGNKAGDVQFNVSANINSSHYKVKNGDAAFWEPGTELYYVEGRPDFLAVKDPSEIGGYRLYLDAAESDGYPQHFKDLKLEEITKIEIYDMFLYDNFSSPELLNTVEDDEELEGFLKMLTGEHAPQSAVLTRNPPDPEIYAAVLYSDGKIAWKFHIYREGKQWLWYPWDREFLPAEIGSFIEK